MIDRKIASSTDRVSEREKKDQRQDIDNNVPRESLKKSEITIIFSNIYLWSGNPLFLQRY